MSRERPEQDPDDVDTHGITTGITAEVDEELFPETLREHDRWMTWKLEDGRKLPIAPHKTGVDYAASAMEEENQMSFGRAKQYVDMTPTLSGLTYTLTEDDGMTLIDLDDVRNPETGEVLPVVWRIIEATESFAQVSTSGTGVHVIVKGGLPDGKRTLTVDLPGAPEAEMEVYPTSRYIAMTGQHIAGAPREVTDADDYLSFIAQWYTDDDGEPVDGSEAEGWDPNKSEEEIEDIATTGDIEDIFDAIKHTEYSDITLKSEKTEERSNGSMSFDPSWAQSQSGTRLGYDDGGWIYRKGGIGLDALQVVALEERIITNERTYPEGDKFWDAVEALRQRGAHIPKYDPTAAGNSGREGEAVGTLPLARLDALPHSERRRYARRRNIDWPDVDEVRNRLLDTIHTAVAEKRTTTISSPTGSGKTYGVATTPWLSMPDVTDERPVIHAHRTREARDQAAGESEEAGVEHFTLKGRTELCSCAAGRHDPDNSEGNEPICIDGVPISEWMEHRCERQGLPFSVVHGWAESEFEGTLPCERGDTECPTKGQFDTVPRDDDGNPNYDVIHCTHKFLQVPSLRLHTHIVVDEKPAFGIELTQDAIRESVNEYLSWNDCPIDSYAELVHASEHGMPSYYEDEEVIRGMTRGEAAEVFREEMDEALSGEPTVDECPNCGGEGKISDESEKYQDVTTAERRRESDGRRDCPRCDGLGDVVVKRGAPPLSWYKENPDAHAMAPAFARAIWNAEESAGERKSARVPYHPPRFDQGVNDDAAWNRVMVDVVLNDQWEVVEAEALPDFSLTDSVIGLDAHPQPADPYWRANVHPDMETEYILSGRERTLYRRYERGLFTVQVGEGVQPVTTGEWLDDGQGEKFDAIVKQLRERYGEDFDAAITSKTAAGHIREAMEDAGVEEPEMMWFGNEESRNDFAGKPVGLVAGSIDPGDNMVMNLCARLDMDVEPAHKDCPVCNGSGQVTPDGDDPEVCETCGGEGEVRERGRTFRGADAEHAEAVLKGVREHHVAQSAGRWARNAADPEDHATVFIVTEAAPDGFIDAHAPGVTWATSEDQKERLEYIRDQSGGATAKEVAEACDCSKQAAWRTLSKARRNGLLERTPGAGPYGADVYSPADAFAPEGVVDLGPDDVENVTGDVLDSYTYTVMVEADPHVAFNQSTREADEWEYQSTLDWLTNPAAPPG